MFHNNIFTRLNSWVGFSLVPIWMHYPIYNDLYSTFNNTLSKYKSFLFKIKWRIRLQKKNKKKQHSLPINNSKFFNTWRLRLWGATIPADNSSETNGCAKTQKVNAQGAAYTHTQNHYYELIVELTEVN